MTEPNEVATLVSRLSRISHAMQFSHGLNPAQWEALRYIGQANRYSSSPSALAKYLGSTKGTISQTLIALESKGLVRRVRNGKDRRKVTLEITLAGRNVLAQDPLGSIIEAAGAITADERDRVVGAMKTMLDDLCVRQGARGFGVCGECCHLRKDETDGTCDGGICGVTEERLGADELDRLCVAFSCDGND